LKSVVFPVLGLPRRATRYERTAAASVAEGSAGRSVTVGMLEEARLAQTETDLSSPSISNDGLFRSDI
jgi:hypothetical protein